MELQFEHVIFAQNLLLLILIPLMIWRSNHRLVRRNWDNWDKRLSEILWAVRKSEPTELRKQAVRHEEQWQSSLATMKELTAALDQQVKQLTAEANAGVSSARTQDIADIRQSAAVLHVLERISKQLTLLDEIKGELAHRQPVPDDEVHNRSTRTLSRLRAGTSIADRSPDLRSGRSTGTNTAPPDAPDVGAEDVVQKWKQLSEDLEERPQS